MNRHEGVSCNHCSKVNFTGKRYKCLRCFDYDLCSVCYLANASNDGHSPKHPLQCIICKGDYNLYYGGEAIGNANVPQSLTCPYCAQMGFTDVTLKEHVTDKHHGASCQVICPICASAPNGDPNFMVSDLSRHLTTVHNVESKRKISFNVEEHIHPRIASLTGNLRVRPNLQVIPPVRSMRSHAPMIVGPDPLTATSSSRDTTDPIDELIMQISRMRRMNNDNGALLEHHRGRCATLQAMHQEIYENRPQAVKQNVFVIQGACNVENAEIVKQEPLPAVPGYVPLLPKIMNEKMSEDAGEEIGEARADFVKEIVYSAMLSKPHVENSGLKN